MTEGGSDGGREGEGSGGREEGRERGSVGRTDGRTDGEKRQGGRHGGQPSLLPCRLSLAAQQHENEFHPIPLENRADKRFCAGLGRAIAAARPVTPFGMLGVNSDNSTHRTPDEAWFGP